MSSHNQPEKKPACASKSSSDSKPEVSYEETFKREAETARRTANDPVVEGVEPSDMRVVIAKPPFWMRSTDGLDVKKESSKVHPLLKENKKCKLNPGIL